MHLSKEEEAILAGEAGEGRRWAMELLVALGDIFGAGDLVPIGMDSHRWEEMGVDREFAQKQRSILRAYNRMGVELTCTCTPYLIGHLPAFGDHLAWSESSAVSFANSA